MVDLLPSDEDMRKVGKKVAMWCRCHASLRTPILPRLPTSWTMGTISCGPRRRRCPSRITHQWPPMTDMEEVTTTRRAPHDVRDLQDVKHASHHRLH